MTRQEIIAEYGWEPEHGGLMSPGKFEGCPIYAPHFSEWAQDGEVLSYMEDGCGSFVSLMEIDDDDRHEFPELGDAAYVCITEDERGFVYADALSASEADKLRDEYEAA